MKLLTVKEVSEIIKVKPGTIYEWAVQGRIPSFKLNRLLRFSEDTILTWINDCKKELPAQYNTSAGRRPRKGGQV